MKTAFFSDRVPLVSEALVATVALLPLGAASFLVDAKFWMRENSTGDPASIHGMGLARNAMGSGK